MKALSGDSRARQVGEGREVEARAHDPIVAKAARPLVGLELPVARAYRHPLNQDELRIAPRVDGALVIVAEAGAAVQAAEASKGARTYRSH